MILTPIALSALPAAIDDFAAALPRQGPAAAALRHIRSSLSLLKGDEVGLSQSPKHHRQAVALLRSFGMTGVDRRPEEGISWDGARVATRIEASVVIHELAHFQLAAVTRRRLPDFGLGAGPESGDKRPGEAARRLHGVDCDREEALASLLGILWEAELGQPAVLAFREQNWLEGGASPQNLAHFSRVSGHLARQGFIDSEGRPTRHCRQDDDDRMFMSNIERTKDIKPLCHKSIFRPSRIML